MVVFTYLISWAARARRTGPLAQLTLLLALLAMLLAGRVARAQTCPGGTRLYVNAANPTPGNGSSWATAYASLADALEVAHACPAVADIWVAQGTYLPGYDGAGNAAPADPRSRTFYLKSGQSLYGGFVGTETALTDRTAGHVTVLSGDFSSNDAVSGSGATLSISNNTENAYHVVVAVNVSTATGLDGCTIQGGNASGGSMYVGGTYVPGNYGGGLYTDALTLSNCTFTGNAAYFGGGVYRASGPGTITNCAFTSNSATTGGGALTSLNGGTGLVLTTCTFTGNSAPKGGAAFLQGSPTFNGCTFTGNSSPQGGALYNDSGSQAALNNCTLTGNTAPNGKGGAMYSYFGATPVLTGCTISNNSATSGQGGALCIDGAGSVLNNCQLTGNSASLGGAVYTFNTLGTSSTTITMTGCTLSSNTAASGGALYTQPTGSITYGLVTLTGCLLTNNTASGTGGALFSSGFVGQFLTGCTFTGNTATAGNGGGIYNTGVSNSSIAPLTVVGCTLSGNKAGGNGGGVCNAASLYGTTPVFTNCVFTGNRASGLGGGMYCSGVTSGSSFIPALTNCTLSANTATTNGGGLYYDTNAGGTVKGCILWNNTSTSATANRQNIFKVAAAATLTVGYSTVGDFLSTATNNYTVSPASSVTTADPRFVNAADPDGADNVFATADDGLELQTGSPVINAGDPNVTTPTTDITGAARARTFDQGAYEYQPVPACAGGTRLYVNAANPTPGTGGSWATAYASLADALERTSFCPITEIWVAQGTYLPGYDANGNAIPTDPRNRTFLLRSRVNLYGGFVGTEAALADRTPGHATILSGDFLGDDATSGSGATLSLTGNAENAYHVLLGASLTAASATALDGLTIRGGSATGAGSVTVGGFAIAATSGGGLYNVSAAPLLTNCTFLNNAATSNGGGLFDTNASAPNLTGCAFTSNTAANGAGMYNTSSSPTLTGCTFTGNRAATSGGGLYNTSSSPTLTNCAFGSNAATNGGGLFNTSGLPVLTTCTFTSNTATNGAGIYNSGSSPTLTTCTLSANSATSGGGLYNSSASPTLNGCTFGGNTASGVGGGMYNTANSGPNLTNCTFSNNTTAGQGGGLYNTSSTPRLTTCTLSGNAAANGGGVYNSSASPMLSGCTFSANTATIGAGLYNSSASAPGLTNCLFTLNAATDAGGGLCNVNSSPTLSGCNFNGNTATNSGGGLYNVSSSPNLTSCVLSGNAADNGGGLYNRDSSAPNLIGCVFSGNTAGSGGGVYNIVSAAPNLNNCVLTGNAASSVGGAMYSSNAAPNLANCTLSANTATTNGGGLYYDNDGGGTVKGCILWNNTGPTANRQNIFKTAVVATPLTVSYSTVSDYLSTAPNNYTATAVTTADPQFVNAADPDGADNVFATTDDGLALQASSPVVNAGDPSVTSPTTDITGAPRQNTFDQGAYEAPVPACPSGTRLYVNAANATPGNGTTWATAFTSLATALEQARACSNFLEVWVAQGTYRPGYDAFGNVAPADPRNRTFLLREGMSVYGGFVGTEANLTDRTAGHATILSGDFLGDDAVSGSGATLSLTGNTENAYHVVVAVSVSAATVLDGFTIRGGNANGSDSYSVSSYNIANNNGGGMHNSGASPLLISCTFTNNAADNGGALYDANNSAPGLTGCAFSANVAILGGAGMANDNSSPTLTSCPFTGNAAAYGGAMFNGNNSTARLVGCTLSGNAATTNGGALYNVNSAPVLTGCVLSGNTAILGGGLYNNISPPNLTNCVLTGNTATSLGGGMYSLGSSPALTNCTLSANTATTDGGGLYYDTNAGGTVKNCLLWNNTSATANRQNIFKTAAATTLTVGYSTVSDFLSSATNNYTVNPANSVTTADPRFVNAADPDGADNVFATADDGLELQTGSPVINAGDPNVTTPTTDITGTARVRTFDQGAYEAPMPTCPGGTRLYVNAANPTPGTGSSWATAYASLADALELARTCTSITNIWVAQGTYKPGYDTNGSVSPPDARSRTFLLKSGVSLYGGFVGTEAALADRTPGHATVLSGDFLGDDAVSGSGATLSLTGNAENAYHVVVAVSVTAASATALDGLTIRGGNATGAGSVTVGGFSITVLNGGGLYNVSASPLLTNCVFLNNNASSSGGALFDTNASAPNLTGCAFNSNLANSGAGVYNTSSAPPLTSCIFTGNRATFNGGGLYNTSSSPTLSGCVFNGNAASNTGGGLYNAGSSPTLTNCAFGSNAATSGGGLVNTSNSTARLTNCLLTGNTATSLGGGMYSLSSLPALTNCTLSGNSATTNGGGLYYDTSAGGTVKSCLLWNNTGPTANRQNIFKVAAATTLTVSYSTVGDFLSSATNNYTVNPAGSVTTADPLFVNAADPDGADNVFATADDGLELQAGSPAINASDPATTTPTTDIIGVPRAGVFDRGAYEFGAALLSVSPNQGPVGTAIVLTGANLQGATAITFTGSSTAVINSGFTVNGTGSSISGLSVPAGLALGTYTLTVTTPSGTTNGLLFTVALPAVPTLTAVSPAAELPGQTVTLTGSNFTAGSSVSFGGVAAASVAYSSATSLTATVPVGAGATVSVTTANGTSPASAFTLLNVADAATLPVGTCTSATAAATGPDSNWHYLLAGGQVALAYNTQGLNLGTVSAELLRADPAAPVRVDGKGHYYLGRNWHLTTSAGPFTGSTVRVRFYALTTEFDQLKIADPANVPTLAALRLTQYSGPNEDCDLANNGNPAERRLLTPATTAGPAGSNFFVSETAVPDHFSEFYLNGGDKPLPVELTAFTATAEGSTAVRLAWATATEKNSQAFEVERSEDGKAFGRISTVAAAGSSSAPRAYELLDVRLPAGAATLYYRLKQLDTDGSFSYSPVRSVAFAHSPIHPFALYPNPAGHGPAHGGAVTLTGAQPGTLVTVFDALGRAVTTATADAAGTAALVLPAGLPTGVYVVRAGSRALRLTVE
ncbi:hypothetical protein GCM10028822_04080 [Hymenobacter terrigena]